MISLAIVKLSTWARENGLSRLTAYRMFRSGKLPCPAEQLATGTILVHPVTRQDESVILYARVSSSDQKSDLDRQISRLSQFAATNKLVVAEIVSEVGSGLNGHRRKLIKSLSKTTYHIMVEHRDRLCRFGFDYLEASLFQSGRKIIVVDPAEITDDVVRDLHEVIVSMCARLYGKRAATNKAKRAMAEVNRDDHSLS